MTAAYCPACLDVWSICADKIARGDWDNVRPGVHMHVTCGRALEAARTGPRKCWCRKPVPASSLDGIHCAEHDDEVAA